MMPDGYSAPITRVYADCVDLLLQNIARHFNLAALDRVGAFDWDVYLLSEMGQLRIENARIIARLTGDISGMTEIALESAMTDALDRTAPDLLKGVKAGILNAPPTGMSAAMQNILRYYSSQAVNQYNLVNTVMLTSSLNAARRVASTAKTAQSVLRDISQGALNTATGEVLTGVSSRQAAVRGAVGQMAKDGIYGFVDKAGHMWSPEAYVNMDVRTTAGNVAREAVFQQNKEYGNDLVIVPVNRTARPKCKPFQNKVISMSGERGKTEDRYGNSVRYISVEDTTYGEPDGLWGINCHHAPDPFVAGISKQHDEPEPDVAERYNATQKQRYYEREVRDAKREAACYEAAGDTDAFEKAAAKVKEKSARLKAYCGKENLPIYTDRTQVFGYNRSVSGKTTAAVKSSQKLQKALADEKVLLPDGTYSGLTQGRIVSSIETFAGKGSNTELRVKQFLVDKYGGVADAWQHSKGRGFVGEDERKAVLHWFYEESVGVRELFVKGWSKK